VYGLVVAIEEPLYSLEPADDAGEPVVTISFVEPGYFRQAVPPELVRLPADHWVSHAFLPDGSVYLRAPDIFEVIVSPDGRRTVCATSRSVDRKMLEANLLNIVLGTALTLQGEEPLHSTAVDLGGRAVALLGPSGAGKSSLAAFLVGSGAGLVTDDMLRLQFTGDGVLAFPGPHRLKLLEEPARRFLPEAAADGFFNAFSGKTMVRPREPAGERRRPVPVSALFYIDDLPGRPASDTVGTERLEGLEVIKVILASAMDDRNASPERLARQMAFAARLTGALPIYALRYPRNFDVMAQVAGEIRRTISRTTDRAMRRVVAT
jgi:hypothetical protein